MNLKRQVAKQLAAYLEAQVPELAGKVHTVHAEPETYAAYPSLYILPGRSTPDWSQERDADDTLPGKLLVELGAWTGTWELRIPGKTPYEREELEQKVLDAFLQREGTPGLVVVEVANVVVGGVTTTHTARAGCSLDSAEWNEEMSFEKKRFSFLDVSVEYPILALRSDVPTIEVLDLAENGDLDSDVVEETVEIESDGTITR